MSGINVSYRGEGPNVTAGNGGGPAPNDVPQRSPNDQRQGIGDSRAVAGDRIGRVMTDGAPARQSVAVNVSVADQVLTQCSRYILITTAGTLAVRLADDAGDQTFAAATLAAGLYPLAIAIVRKTGTTAVGVLLF